MRGGWTLLAFAPVPSPLYRRVASALGLLALIGGLGLARPAEASSTAPRTYYLAIGASEAAGVQPSLAHPAGLPTNEGYANDLLATERARWPGLRLVEIACPGITAVGAVNGVGPCRFPGGSELAAAVAFLAAHRSSTVLVTVDLGFNDLVRCLSQRAVDRGCVRRSLRRTRRALGQIVDGLRAAGGPGLDLVGLEHNDPYLGEYTFGAAGRVFALRSLRPIEGLNAVVSQVYAGAGFSVAEVPAAFKTADRRLVEFGRYGDVPTDVAEICASVMP